MYAVTASEVLNPASATDVASFSAAVASGLTTHPHLIDLFDNQGYHGRTYDGGPAALVQQRGLYARGSIWELRSTDDEPRHLFLAMYARKRLHDSCADRAAIKILRASASC